MASVAFSACENKLAEIDSIVHLCYVFFCNIWKQLYCGQKKRHKKHHTNPLPEV